MFYAYVCGFYGYVSVLYMLHRWLLFTIGSKIHAAIYDESKIHISRHSYPKQTGGLSHPHQFGESTFNLRRIMNYFNFFLFLFMKFSYTNSIASALCCVSLGRTTAYMG